MCLIGCDKDPWNDPYPFEDPKANTLYSQFSDRPKHLDPAQSYSEPEWELICQIYEPPLQYHYLKRPFVLEPLTATSLPEVQFLNAAGEKLSEDAPYEQVKYSDYIIHIKPGIYYQKHPAFVKNADGLYRYHSLTLQQAEQYRVLKDFTEIATRELIAEDYVYQIKRLAEPNLSSPIYGLMNRYIKGLKELREDLLQTASKEKTHLELDLRPYVLEGTEVIDRYTYKIRIIGKYPQFKFWLAMPFFAPVPWEVAQFYAQSGFKSHNISLDWYPVGTGPYELVENNPERRMILQKNPSFRVENYPTEGTSKDIKVGLLEDEGKRIPFLDKVVFSLEKEQIPFWNKFLQGYYDVSGISSDHFGSAIQITDLGNTKVSQELEDQRIRLQTSFSPSVWYWGFNMLDPTVGGYSEKAKKLRLAIKMAFDVEEYISIFMNGRGVPAMGPIPPDIFGFQTEAAPVAANITQAKALLKEAGFEKGLTLYFDTVETGSPSEIATEAWLQEQFAKIGITLVVRGTDYNRFQDKLQSGTVQIYLAGWNADYPDPENFLSLLYGPNSSVGSEGENNSNYHNPQYDNLFDKMRVTEDEVTRLEYIQEMIQILQEDTPWLAGFYPKSFTLYHQWVRIGKPSGVINNNLKYARINPELRAKQRALWNQPRFWPLWGILLLLFILITPAAIRFWKKEHRALERLLG